MIHIEQEIMSNEFTKHHIKGLPVDAVIHHFTAKDIGGFHDHPYSFKSIILSGSYIEEILYKTKFSHYTVREQHTKGDIFEVKATHIHQIVSLPEKECWTLIFPQKWEQEWGFYKIVNSEIYYRQYNEKQWIKL